MLPRDNAIELKIAGHSVDENEVNPKRARQSGTYDASSVRLVIVLYDKLIQDISQADDALALRRPEQCAMEIAHALAVIGYLQATRRRRRGSDVARKAGCFYTMLREKLMEAQVRSSRQILSELQQQLRERREP
jgi:flagellin-specific chaperone FliS